MGASNPSIVGFTMGLKIASDTSDPPTSSGKEWLVAVALVMVIVAVLYGLRNCSQQIEDEWRGFLYPDRDNLRDSVELGVFESLEVCRDAARSHSEFVQLNSDYKCGLNCKSRDGMFVCEETKN